MKISKWNSSEDDYFSSIKVDQDLPLQFVGFSPRQITQAQQPLQYRAIDLLVEFESHIHSSHCDSSAPKVFRKYPMTTIMLANRVGDSKCFSTVKLIVLITFHVSPTVETITNQ